jgi:hypothetical protein
MQNNPEGAGDKYLMIAMAISTLIALLMILMTL